MKNLKKLEDINKNSFIIDVKARIFTPFDMTVT